MNLLSKPENSNLNFVLDGGLLVNFYGFDYETSDLDLVVGFAATNQGDLRDVKRRLMGYLSIAFREYTGIENYVFQTDKKDLIIKISERYSDGQITPLIDIGINAINEEKTKSSCFEKRRKQKEALFTVFGSEYLKVFKLKIYRERLEKLLERFIDEDSNLTEFGDRYNYKLTSWLNQCYHITVKNWNRRSLDEMRAFIDLYNSLFPHLPTKDTF